MRETFRHVKNLSYNETIAIESANHLRREVEYSQSGRLEDLDFARNDEAEKVYKKECEWRDVKALVVN